MDREPHQWSGDAAMGQEAESLAHRLQGLGWRFEGVWTAGCQAYMGFTGRGWSRWSRVFSLAVISRIRLCRELRS